MSVDIIKIIIDVLKVFPLIMAIVLYIDYKINEQYNIEIDIKEFEDLKLEKDIMMRLINKVKEVVCIK